MQRGAFLLALASLIPTWALAAPHVTRLPPQNAAVHCAPGATCTQPTVDGWVPPMEYADGKKFPLQDYVNGGPNGELYLFVSDNAEYTSDECNFGVPNAGGIPSVQTNPCHSQTLFIGMRLPRPKDANGNFLDASGIIDVWLDAQRDATINQVAGANMPRSEDRHLQLRYSTGPNGNTTLSQRMGNNANGWMALTAPNQAWATSVTVATPGAQPSRVHIEFAVKLRSSVPPIAGSEPLSALVRKLGLGLQSTVFSVAGATQKVGGGTFPNVKNQPPVNFMPSTWETLELKEPVSIPLSFTMWNVGQMPDATFWVSDGGSGEIDTVAAKIFRKEVACISEIWMSHERGELIEKVNALRAIESLPPMQAVTELNDDVLKLATESTGLVLLSSRQILEGGVHHFPSHMCTGNDCLQDKGVIWARIATPAATEPVIVMEETGASRVSTATDYGEFVDVFCTHVNAGENVPGPDTDAREDQLFDIKAYVQQVRKGGPLHANTFPYLLGDDDIFPQGTWPSGLDRPAFLLGDMNTLGPKATQADSNFPAYQDMVGPSFLAINQRTEFEKANTLFSEARDLARTSSGPDPMATGTWLSSQCTDLVTDELGSKDRLDYVLVFPAEDTLEFPAYALLKEPTADVKPHFDPDSGFLLESPQQFFQQCLSDHAMVDVSVALTRVKDVVKYNPAKPHRMEYAVKQVTDLETESGCCADWFTPRVHMTANGFFRENAFLNVVEDQTIYPNWLVHTGPDNPTQFPDLPANFTGVVNMTSAIWEEDVGPNDHYDSIPEGGAGTTVDERDGHFSFFAGSGMVRRVKGETNPNDWFMGLELMGSFLNGYENGMTLETEGKDMDTGDNARVRHYIQLKELESP
ncbi:hypothetical protein HUA76_35640 [Myxococcus sp. CA056]|uniref:hypothetical protein n=1 Tax=unclassified Myxococcus TaxID=2648731 RepID=UPI00157A6D0F|nr:MULTISPECIES: hypothetical protein [unclassified Myxococcus]NTX16117.1 hypothetical protein [Myxococcus sp. CA056]NTX39798.1 hypothetical protein [Myxococcus sp. CA033]